LLVTVRVEFTVPAACGLNVIVYETLCPAAMVTGNVSPPTLKAELLVLAAVTVTLAPLAVSLPVPELLSPTVTLPRLRVAGEALSVPTAAVPVPDKDTVNRGFEALEVTVTFPLAVPVVLGANFTVKVTLCPAPRVKEELMPLSVNPVPLMDTLETETLEPPLFVMVPESD